MAIGPPGAPTALYMNSSEEVEKNARFLDLETSERSLNNNSQTQILNDLVANESQLAFAADYWFLADPSYKHEVNSTSLRRLSVAYRVLNIATIRWSQLSNVSKRQRLRSYRKRKD
jgi:hypothetical protein